jgi:outer membrane protein OmpA-like peptidoglycan-associated protein
MGKPTLSAVAIAALAAGTLGLSGCATKGFVRQQVGVEDQKVQATQGQVTAQQTTLQGHEQHLGELDKNTREALERAEAAGKLAEGKFLYSMVLSDDSVKFPVESSELSPEAKARLTEFAQKLKTDNKNVYLEIQGHTDKTGSPEVNRRLGEERAEAVRRFMNEQGVALNRMNTISYGPDSPVASNKTRAGRAQNRRVVVVVLA